MDNRDDSMDNRDGSMDNTMACGDIELPVTELSRSGSGSEVDEMKDDVFDPTPAKNPGKIYSPRTWKTCWDQKMKGSPLLASFNIICCVVGVGIFGLPYVLSQSGWIGVLFLLITYAMSTYTCVILGDVIKAADGATSYGDLGQAAFGSVGRWLVSISQYVTLIGVGAIFLVVIASGMKQVFPNVFPSCSTNVAIFGAVVLFHIFFHKLNEVAIMSAFNVAVAIAVTVVVCIEAVANADPDARTVVVNSAHDDFTFEILIAFPNIAFAFGCQFIIPQIYDELKDKKTFKPMCYCAMLPTLLMYLPVAILGYWAFGDKVKDPVFKNFSGSAIDVIIILLVVHLLMSYAIVLNPPELAFEQMVVKLLSSGRMAKVQAPLRCLNRFNRWPLRIVLRLILTGLTVLIAWAIPCFSILLSLVSSITGTLMFFVFPVLFYLKLVSNVRWWQKIFCYFCLLFSAVGGVGGAYNAILGMRSCQPSTGGC